MTTERNVDSKEVEMTLCPEHHKLKKVNDYEHIAIVDTPRCNNATDVSLAPLTFVVHRSEPKKVRNPAPHCGHDHNAHPQRTCEQLPVSVRDLAAAVLVLHPQKGGGPQQSDLERSRLARFFK